MARNKQTLVFAASCLLTALVKQASPTQSYLFCVTFLKPNTNEIILNVGYSDGTDNVTMNLDNNCVRSDTDLLTVKIVQLQHQQILLNMSYGECAVSCLNTTDRNEVKNITRPSNESVLCTKVVLQTIDFKGNCELCTNTTMSKSTDQQSETTPALPMTSTSNSTHTTTEEGPAVALLAVLVVEVVASIILSVVAVMVVREARSTTIIPATTTVRRASSHDLYVCENDLYEPFPGSTAAELEEKKGKEEEKKKEKKVVLKFRSITKKQKKRTNEEEKQD